MTSSVNSEKHQARAFPPTPGVVWAVARQTLAQCLRKKVLFVLGFFLVTVVIADQLLLSHEPAKHIGLLITACLFAISFFGVIVAVFLAATGLPEDRESGTVTTVLTKPVGRINYLLGRILGFWMTMGILVAVMGVVSCAVVRLSAWHMGAGDLLVCKRGLDPQADDVRLIAPEGVRTLRSDVVPVLRGSVNSTIVFSFRDGLDRLREGGEQTLEITPMIVTGLALPTTGAEVVIENPVTGEKARFGDELLSSKQTTSLRFSSSLIDPDEGVTISFRRLTPGVRVEFPRGLFQIMISPVPFEYTMLKSLVAVMFGFCLITVVAVMAGTVLSSWVAVLVSFAAYFFSASQELLLNFMQGLSGESVGLLGMQEMAHQHGPVVAPAPDPIYVIVVNKIAYGLMWALTHIFPSFDTFSASRFVGDLRDIPAAFLLTAAVIGMSYALCYTVLSHVLFWRKELSP